MTDPSAPARYDDDANVEATARDGEVVLEVAGATEEASTGDGWTIEFATPKVRADFDRLMKECEEREGLCGVRVVTDKPVSWRGCTVDWTSAKRLY